MVTVFCWLAPRPPNAATTATTTPPPIRAEMKGIAKVLFIESSLAGSYERGLKRLLVVSKTCERAQGRLRIGGSHQRLPNQHGVHAGILEPAKLRGA